MNHPDVWPGILLALAAFRITRLVGWDDLTITARRWVTGLGDQDHHEWAHVIDQLRQDGKDPWDPPRDTASLAAGESWQPPPVSESRFYLGKMVRCPWCAGWWISLGVWLAWLASPGGTVWVCVPFAVSAIVGLVSKQLDS